MGLKGRDGGGGGGGGGKGDDGATEFGEFQTNEDNFLCAKLGRFHH